MCHDLNRAPTMRHAPLQTPKQTTQLTQVDSVGALLIDDEYAQKFLQKN